MATAYALALRQRALLLPWNFMMPAAITERKQLIAHWCAATDVCYTLLAAVDQLPKHRPVPAKASCVEQGHCFYCKTPLLGARGLVESCSNCYVALDALPDHLRQQYFLCFENTLRFSQWDWPLDMIAGIDPETSWYDRLVPPPALPVLTKAQAMQLAAKQKLGIS